MATWQMTYAPYVADYSRYLPTDTPLRQTFWYTYLGSVVSSSWMMILGATAAVVAPKESKNMVQYLGHLSGPSLSLLTYVLIVLGVLAINALNLYGGFMSAVTTVCAFAAWKVTARTRIIFILTVAALGTLLGIWGQGDFLDHYSKFLLLLLYFMVPWTAINLVDYYLLRKGNYNIPAIFDPDGEYGKVNGVAVWAYVVGTVVQFPFMNTELFVGPLAKYMNGADLAWVVGLIVPAVLYYFPMRKRIGDQAEIQKK
jgi:NCS1 family nucleobase:cation symporter-1